MSVNVKGITNKKHSSRSHAVDYKFTLRHEFNTNQFSVKRGIDIIFASINLVLLILLFPLIYIGIKCSSKGSVIFTQRRSGKFGLPFTCYKFRTMHTEENLKRKTEYKRKNNDDDTVTVTEKGDPRVFWFGSVLRKTNLDELPQIINILKGDMSFVGPRPYEVSECKFWNDNLENYGARFLVRPGLSGLAQVQGHRGGTRDLRKMRKRLDCDIYYVENQSIMLDFKIIIKTIKQMACLDTNAH